MAMLIFAGPLSAPTDQRFADATTVVHLGASLLPDPARSTAWYAWSAAQPARRLCMLAGWGETLAAGAALGDHAAIRALQRHIPTAVLRRALDERVTSPRLYAQQERAHGGHAADVWLVEALFHPREGACAKEQSRLRLFTTVGSTLAMAGVPNRYFVEALERAGSIDALDAAYRALFAEPDAYEPALQHLGYLGAPLGRGGFEHVPDASPLWLTARDAEQALEPRVTQALREFGVEKLVLPGLPHPRQQYGPLTVSWVATASLLRHEDHVSA